MKRRKTGKTAGGLIPEKWCATCQKDTHNTKDCWGQGTVAVPREPQHPIELQFQSNYAPPKRK